MELDDALRSTGSIREFTAEPVPAVVLGRVLDTARFSPSGGNRQGWRVVVVEDAQKRAQLRDLYLDGWYEYLAIGRARLTPWAPITDRDAETKAAAGAGDIAQAAAAAPGFAELLHEVPVLLAVFVDLRALAAVDRDFE